MSYLEIGTDDWEGWVFDNYSSEETVEECKIKKSDKERKIEYRGPRDRRTFLPVLEHQLLPSTCEDEFVRKYNPGSLVWAKVTGHPDPAWPARVTRIRENKGVDLVYRVNFFRTKEWADVREKELFPYSEIGDKEFSKVKVKFVGGTRKRKLFEEAVDDIRNEYKYYYLKVPRIEAVLDKNIKSSPVELPLINPAVAKYCDSNMNLKTTASKM